MSALIWIITAIGMICTTAPAIAQTYDPNYPVCLQSYAHDGYIDSSYTPVQCDGFGPGGYMLQQPILRTTQPFTAALTCGRTSIATRR